MSVRRTATLRSRSVSFRVTEDEYRELTRHANAVGLSPGEFARLATVQRVQNRQQQFIEEEVAAIRDDQARLRDDLATVTRAILVALDVPEPEAERFVREALLLGG
ncbi:plasmid mobilization protein [Tautonia rosea]|uniref:plasmid mobilization protein n=1 Tax=Tautonia rosea TaxID=2728037 RepID=UPI0014742601|nr:hypothetical protein [Tautonia rosea]